MKLSDETHDKRIEIEDVRGNIKVWQQPYVRQSFIVIGLMSLMFSAGVGFGTATVMLPQLKKNKGEILVDETMSSWIYSSQGFGSVPAVLIIPYLSQWKGYKLVFKLICMPLIIAFTVQYFATSAFHLVIVALCQGVTMGGNVSLGIIAITEFAEPKLRSIFLIMKAGSYFWGVWVANSIGTFYYWRNIPLFGIFPAAFSFISCFLWPEGPYWLASKGRIDECEQAFRWLRGFNNGTEELSSIIKNQVRTKKNRNQSLLTQLKTVIMLREFYMPLVVNSVLFCLYHFSCKLIVTVYALVIIKEVTKSETMAYAGMLIIDGFTVVGMYLGSYVAMKFSRRSLFLYSSAVSILFLYTLSVYLSLIQYKVFSQNAIVSLSLLVMYSFCVSWGPMVLSTSFLSEITPMRFKPFVISVSSLVFWILFTTTLKLTPFLFENVGMHGSFGIYGTLALICWIFLYFFLPETSNKTLQELEFCFVKDIRKLKDKFNENFEEDSMLKGKSAEV